MKIIIVVDTQKELQEVLEILGDKEIEIHYKGSD